MRRREFGRGLLGIAGLLATGTASGEGQFDTTIDQLSAQSEGIDRLLFPSTGGLLDANMEPLTEDSLIAVWAESTAVINDRDGDVSESALWEYNHKVQTDFGQRFAAMDLYNVFGSAHEVDELTDIVTALPGEMIIDLMGKKGETSLSLTEKLTTSITTLVKTRGHWRTLYDAYKVGQLASQLKEVYDEYPTTPDGFEQWRDRRDAIMDEVYEVTGAEPKY